MNDDLKEIKKSIQDECISQGEIAYLESHKQEVLNTGDVELCQWAGITEEEYFNRKLNPDSKVYIIRVKVENEPYDNYEEIQQTLYDMGAIDVDLLEIYDD